MRLVRRKNASKIARSSTCYSRNGYQGDATRQQLTSLYYNKDAYERICSFYYHTKWWSCRDKMNFCLRSFLSSSADHWTRGEIEIPIEISGDLNAPTRNNAPVIPRYCILYELLRANEQFEVISIFELFRLDERLVKLFSRYFEILSICINNYF